MSCAAAIPTLVPAADDFAQAFCFEVAKNLISSSRPLFKAGRHRDLGALWVQAGDVAQQLVYSRGRLHADGIQAYAPGATGNVTITNSTIVSHDDLESLRSQISDCIGRRTLLIDFGIRSSGPNRARKTSR